MDGIGIETIHALGTNVLAWRSIAALLETPLLTPTADPDLWFTLNADPAGLSSGERVLYDLAGALLHGDTRAVLTAPMWRVDEPNRVTAETVVQAWLGAR